MYACACAQHSTYPRHAVSTCTRAVTRSTHSVLRANAHTRTFDSRGWLCTVRKKFDIHALCMYSILCPCNNMVVCAHAHTQSNVYTHTYTTRWCFMGSYTNYATSVTFNRMIRDGCRLGSCRSLRKLIAPWERVGWFEGHKTRTRRRHCGVGDTK